MSKDLVMLKEGKALTTSLKIAEVFEKEHKHVMDSIKNIGCSVEFSQSNFRLSDYISDRGKKYPMYEITRDGMSFLVMGFTGSKASGFKEDFIKAFNLMESKLNNQPVFDVPKTYGAALRLAADLQEKVEAMKPKAEYFDALVDRNLLTNIRDTAKELNTMEKYFVTYLIDNKYCYRTERKELRPYAQFVPELFQLKDWVKNGLRGVQLLVTPKGKETFRLLVADKETLKTVVKRAITGGIK